MGAERTQSNESNPAPVSKEASQGDKSDDARAYTVVCAPCEWRSAVTFAYAQAADADRQRHNREVHDADEPSEGPAMVETRRVVTDGGTETITVAVYPNGGAPDVFHKGADCPRITGDSREVARSQYPDARPCKTCHNQADNRTNRGNSDVYEAALDHDPDEDDWGAADGAADRSPDRHPMTDGGRDTMRDRLEDDPTPDVFDLQTGAFDVVTGRISDPASPTAYTALVMRVEPDAHPCLERAGFHSPQNFYVILGSGDPIGDYDRHRIARELPGSAGWVTDALRELGQEVK